MSTAVRLGIIGPGLMWKRRHEPVLAPLHASFTISAFCASSERSHAEIAHKYPGTPFVTDYRAFVQRTDVDAVVVLTPIPLNAPVALAALQAGKDVLLEKPMACTLEEAQTLVQGASRTGKRLWVLEQDAYDTRWCILRDLIHSGEIGDVVTYDLMMHLPLDADQNDAGGYGRTNWRRKPDFPLGTLFDGGHHQIAMLSTLFGTPQWVFASGVSLRPEFGEFDHVLIQFGYAGHLRGTFSHSGVLRPGHNHFTITGTKGLITVDRVGATVDYTNGTKRVIPLTPVSLAIRHGLMSELAHEMMWQAFAHAYAEGREPDYPPADAVRDLSILLAIARSARKGERIMIGN